MAKYKNKHLYILALFASGILFLAACAQTPVLTDNTGSGSTQVSSGSNGFDLAAALEAAGGQVERSGVVQQPFFNVEGERLFVNGAEVQVFFFPDQKSRQAVSNLISADGSTVGTYSMNWMTVPHFWAKDNLIVLYLGTDESLTGLLDDVLGSPITASPTQEAVESTPEPDSAPIAAAITNLSQALGIGKDEIRVLSSDQVNWPDSCLGISQKDVACAEMITPGWRITLEAGGVQYEFHTDMTGENIGQVKEDASLGFGLDQEYPPAVIAAVQKLSQALSVSNDRIAVKSYDPVSWPDSCLGLAQPGEMCLQVITPGYSVQLESGGKFYEVHTDQRGNNLRIKGFGLENPRTSIDRSKAVMAAVRKLSETTGVNVGDIKVLSSEAEDWPDACLGLAQEGEVCAQTVTPGWRIMLETGSQQYEVHSDQTGEQVRMADQP